MIKVSLKIITHPNPILRKKAKAIAVPVSGEIVNLAKEMFELMINSQGIGLAAPQVGISKRLVVIAHQNEPLILFNPRIVKKSLKKEINEEGCLSIPDVFGNVKRHQKITVKADLASGDKTTLQAGGLLARVIQHEVDHLDGILFIDKIEEYINDSQQNE